MSTITTIPVVDNGYRDGFKATVELVVNGRRYGIGGWDETQVGRIGVGRSGSGSYRISGPVAYGFLHCTVIAAHPLPQEPQMHAEMGETVSINGYLYEIRPANNDNIELVPVDMPAYNERPIVED
jgi:hypothetical protein